MLAYFVLVAIFFLVFSKDWHDFHGENVRFRDYFVIFILAVVPLLNLTVLLLIICKSKEG